jgi:hypothetical protein
MVVAGGSNDEIIMGPEDFGTEEKDPRGI